MSSHITVTVTFRKKTYVAVEDYVAFVKEAVREWSYCTNGMATKGADYESGDPATGPLWGIGAKARVELQK